MGRQRTHAQELYAAAAADDDDVDDDGYALNWLWLLHLLHNGRGPAPARPRLSTTEPAATPARRACRGTAARRGRSDAATNRTAAKGAGRTHRRKCRDSSLTRRARASWPQASTCMRGEGAEADLTVACSIDGSRRLLHACVVTGHDSGNSQRRWAGGGGRVSRALGACVKQRVPDSFQAEAFQQTKARNCARAVQGIPGRANGRQLQLPSSRARMRQERT